MNAMTDDAMALTVAEATMQDWLAALEVIRTCPPPAWTPSLQRSPSPLSHPSIVEFSMSPARRPLRRQVASAARRVADDHESAVGGARTAYWLALAAALAVMLII